jgi:hypothetical protein
MGFGSPAGAPAAGGGGGLMQRPQWHRSLDYAAQPEAPSPFTPRENDGGGIAPVANLKNAMAALRTARASKVSPNPLNHTHHAACGRATYTAACAMWRTLRHASCIVPQSYCVARACGCRKPCWVEVRSDPL